MSIAENLFYFVRLHGASKVFGSLTSEMFLQFQRFEQEMTIDIDNL